MFFFFGILCFLLQLFSNIHALLIPTIGPIVSDVYPFYFQLTLSSLGTKGPESVLLDKYKNGPYAGVADGRILKYNGTDFVDFAYLSPNRTKEVCDGTADKILGPTCGRALGLIYDPSTGNFYSVNAFGGLYMIGPNGGLATPLTTVASGVASTFLNGIDYDHYRNVIYFTSPSKIVTYRDVMDGKAPAPPGDSTGRLFEYNISSGDVTVLLENFPGAGGPAVCSDGTCILIPSRNTNQIFKYFLVGPKAGKTESLLKLPGYPVKIERAPTRGLLWVAVNVVVSGVTQPFGYKFSQSGVVTLIKNFTKEYPNTQVNAVQEYDDLSGAKLLLGSRFANYVGIYKFGHKQLL